MTNKRKKKIINQRDDWNYNQKKKFNKAPKAEKAKKVKKAKKAEACLSEATFF